MDKAKVIVATPHLADLPGYFVDSLMGLCAASPVLSFVHLERHIIHTARELMAKITLVNPEATHLFFMDSDMVFPAQALNRLLARDKDIVGGCYMARTETPIPHIYRFKREDEDGLIWYQAMTQELTAWIKTHPETASAPRAHVFSDSPDALVRADALGTGCMLIKRRVLEGIAEPRFEFPATGAFGGEDFDFCRKARAAGFEVWGDFSVQCAHESRPYFQGVSEFVDAYAIGTEDEIDPAEPILIELGPNGRTVVTGVRDPAFKFPDDVEGYRSASQGYLLYTLAKSIPQDGTIVELGCYKGRSTICLAQAGRKVYAVDHFKGEKLDLLNDRGAAYPDHISGADYSADLNANLGAYGVRERVQIVRGDSVWWGNRWGAGGQKPISLLFIDAAHDYESVKADFAAWERHLTPEAIVVFDDLNFPGVEAVVAEAGQRGWRHIDNAGPMVALRRSGGTP